MLYYRVNRQHYTGRGHLLGEGELITHKEMARKYPEVFPLHYIKRGILTEVEVSKQKTFWFCGCRFPNHDVQVIEIYHPIVKY